MRVTVSQQDLPAGRHGKKISIEFKRGNGVDNYVIDKADEFISAVDKFLKRHNNLKSPVLNADLKFVNVSILTERIIRATIAGLRFSTLRVVPRRGK